MESSSDDESSGAGNKRLKLEDGEDRFSSLPDPLIHHILSFLPLTKQAIQTGILSKRWQYQWTRVPFLLFNYTGMSDNTFSQFIDRTLTQHDCSKLKKFYIHGPLLTSKIHFASRKKVEELILHHSDPNNPYVLPEFLFNNDSLLKLDLFQCLIRYEGRINWSSLKELKLDYQYYYSCIEHILSGCPSLELLELRELFGFYNMVIASKSLKRLIFVDVRTAENIHSSEDKLEITCPNLEELSIKVSQHFELPSELPAQTIENALSCSPLLHTLELPDYHCVEELSIASKSLKKLVLGRISAISELQISCPKLEDMNLYRFVPEAFPGFDNFKSMSRWERRLGKKILRQLQHVKLLEFGSWFIEILSTLEVEVPSSPLLSCKCLTLNGTNFDEHLPGIVCAIRCSPVLEKLVVNLQLAKYQNCADMESDDCGENDYWDQYPNKTVFNCSVSNLKMVKICGLLERDDKHKHVFKFVEFLLENARMLENISIILADYGTGFMFEVSKKILSFQRRFPCTTIELLPST